MKVVVTGGAGFIGANLCRHLMGQPFVDSVVVVDDLSTGMEVNLEGSGATLLHGSILDAHLLDQALDGAAAVVHLAAVPSVPRSLVDPLTSHHANATGTLEILEAVRRAGRPHVVVASSSSVYGANRQLPKRETMRTAPLSPYAVSKLAAESYALAYAYCFGLDVLAFRFFNVFGPLQGAGHAYAAVVPAFVDAALNGNPLVVHGNGEQTRDFTFVETVCSVITAAVEKRVGDAEPVNLAFGTRTSLNQLIARLEEVLGHGIARRYVDPRPGDVQDSQADGSRLHALFPDVDPTALFEGLQRTVDWFRSGVHVPPG